MIRPNDQHPLMQRGEVYRDYRDENVQPPPLWVLIWVLMIMGLMMIWIWATKHWIQIFYAVVFSSVAVALFWLIHEMRVVGQ